MTLQRMIDLHKDKYICVCGVHLDNEGLIEKAVVLRVYDTLEQAYENKQEIIRFIKNFKDFDIIYGDIEDYISTRRNKGNPIHHQISPKQQLTQNQIDTLIKKLSYESLDDVTCIMTTQLPLM